MRRAACLGERVCKEAQPVPCCHLQHSLQLLRDVLLQQLCNITVRHMLILLGCMLLLAAGVRAAWLSNSGQEFIEELLVQHLIAKHLNSNSHT